MDEAAETHMPLCMKVRTEWAPCLSHVILITPFCLSVSAESAQRPQSRAQIEALGPTSIWPLLEGSGE